VSSYSKLGATDKPRIVRSRNQQPYQGNICEISKLPFYYTKKLRYTRFLLSFQFSSL